ncbi:hypothetical protein B9G53_17935 [Pseudanabaena sp. SR411]|nr:hypothetical protein B9G53_17935 [Pseudanabaena sp. SR411]
MAYQRTGYIATQEIARTKIKTQKMSGGASLRHSSFGFYVLSKTCIAIVTAMADQMNHKRFFESVAKQRFQKISSFGFER